MATEYNSNTVIFKTVSATDGFAEYLGVAKTTSTNATKYTLSGVRVGDIVRIVNEGNRLEQYLGPTNTDVYWLSGSISYGADTTVYVEFRRTSDFKNGEPVFSTPDNAFRMYFDNTADYSSVSWEHDLIVSTGAGGLWMIVDAENNLVAVNAIYNPYVYSLESWNTNWVSPYILTYDTTNFPTGSLNGLPTFINGNEGATSINILRQSLPAQYNDDNWRVLRNTFELYIDAAASLKNIWVVGLDGTEYTVSASNSTYLGWVSEPFRLFAGPGYDYNMSGVTVLYAFPGTNASWTSQRSINSNSGCDSDLFFTTYRPPLRGYLSIKVESN